MRSGKRRERGHEIMEVCFYSAEEERELKYAVIVSRYEGQWVLCKHKERTTWEFPGGHIEEGEEAIAAAKRELYEETGAVRYEIVPICIYGVKDEEEESFGLLCFAEITEFGPLPEMEIEKAELFEELPKNWTYPLVQPYLLKKVGDFLMKKE